MNPSREVAWHETRDDAYRTAHALGRALALALTVALIAAYLAANGTDMRTVLHLATGAALLLLVGAHVHPTRKGARR